MTLVGGQKLINVHSYDQCAGEFCCIHNPSDHHMKDWPQNWRGDRGIMERMCPCGIGHPDFDDPIFKLFPYEDVHGCCGHCRYDLKIKDLPARWITEGYAIGSDGRVWSFFKTIKPKQLTGRPNDKGYLRVQIFKTDNGNRKDSYIHRLMWEVWKEEIPQDQQIRHLDGNKTNNCLWNLAIGTQTDNEADKERHGRVPRGKQHKNSKLTEHIVVAARICWRQGMTLDDILEKLKLTVSRTTLHQAVIGETWKQLDPISPPFKPGRW